MVGHIRYSSKCTMGYSEEFRQLLVRRSAATRYRIDRWKELLEQWRDDSGASGAIAFGEAIAIKP